MSRGTKGGGGHSQLRIIGGQWRGRKLKFTPVEGLRPTADRVRETLFNWLNTNVHSANCLDLFAGSGALGLEALSRGASHCDFVDSAPVVIRQLQSQLQLLNAQDRGKCHAESALSFLREGAGTWDIVFVDPPFGQGLVDPACQLIANARILSANAMVYVETATQEVMPALPDNWELHREKQAGGVCFRLFVVHSE